MILQFGITLITPILLCVGLCFWLCDAFSLGSWVYIPGILLGLGASAVSGYRFCTAALKFWDRRGGKRKKGDSREDKKVSFNDHI